MAPCERRADEAAARGRLPLGLRRQALAAPRGVGIGIGERDVHHRVIVTARDARARAARRAPARPRAEAPPLRRVLEVDRPGAHREERRSRRVGTLGDRQVTGRGDELGEGTVRDRRAIHVKGGDLDVADGLLLGVVLVGPETVAAGRDRDHVRVGTHYTATIMASRVTPERRSRR